jgi:glycosyltransferase involved in cell wall biosynthesis
MLAERLLKVIGSPQALKNMGTAGRKRAEQCFDVNKLIQQIELIYEEVSSKNKRRPVRVLFFEPSTGYGGSSRCLLEWLRHLNREKFSPLVITYYNGPAIKQIRELGVKVIRLPYITLTKKLMLASEGGTLVSYIAFLLETLINTFPVALALAVIILVKRIDLVDLNSSIGTSIPGIIAAKLTRRPSVCHIHDTRRLSSKEVYFGKWVEKHIVLTHAAEKLYTAGLGADKLTVIYNGLSLDCWNGKNDGTGVREEFGIGPAEYIIGMAGRITKGKGHDDFITAASLVKRVNSRVKFLIVGSAVFTDKGLEGELQDMVKKLGLENTVIFTGWRDDVKRLMSAFDVLVFPTSTFPEGFPVTCIEAMALGKPVVATNIPGPSEIVLDGVTGFLVAPSDPDMLAERLLKVIGSPQALKNMGTAGRKRAEEVFDIIKLTREIELVFDEVA